MKKFLALVTLVCMVLTASVAFAAFPSKTAQDLTAAETGMPVNGVVPEAGFAIFVTDPTEPIEAEIAAMADHVATDVIATYYDEETQAKLAELVADPAALVAYELVPVACSGYKAEYGDVPAKFVFATAFEEGAELTVAVKTDVWSVQKCVVEEGKVEVLFTGAELTQMEAAPALMVVMSTPIA
ncbi:MAG: hypothetical protein IJZ74_06120 [Clostridia bacterium]|nr:hypothetical protein [Clostridia bacterium]